MRFVKRRDPGRLLSSSAAASPPPRPVVYPATSLHEVSRQAERSEERKTKTTSGATFKNKSTSLAIQLNFILLSPGALICKV